MKNTLINIVTLAALSFASSSAAVITTYNRAAFSAAVAGGTITEQNFDSIANGTILGTFDGVTYGASNGNPIVTDAYLTTTGANGLGSTSFGFFKSTELATFSFASPITAFAIDVNTFAPTAGDYSATINLGNTIPSRFDVFPSYATGQFIGFTSDTAFTSVTIGPVADPNGGAYSYTLDTLIYGGASALVNVTASAPEPSTFVALGLGLVCVGMAKRKRG